MVRVSAIALATVSTFCRLRAAAEGFALLGNSHGRVTRPRCVSHETCDIAVFRRFATTESDAFAKL
jgi:hypothetical protein